MADIEGIARELYNIIISPDTVTGLINGGLSVPLDYGYLIYGIFDTDTRYERETERIRMMTAIRHDILNYENIVNAVKLIFQLFNKYISESEQDRIYRSVVTSIVCRISTNIIASNIAKAVIEKTSFTYVVFKGKGNPIAFLSTILLFGGMAERSIRTSDKLRNETPEVYSLLRPRDYDLLYFLIADAVQPFMDTIHAGYTEDNPVFDKIMKRVEDHLNTNAKAG
ncbi:hypothetical protein [Klebsiella pneumoniae]|uniref:hypothetical protein n=1 Tax=Klebsiella pneumoniae TaxID=573 RepID=UPI000B961EC3|nr:hypothetical protein [Klebsiella pneumoniae]MCS6700715.1 hypothetical protein [Klebsiella pneumoniae subsp. pneumoniae]QDJ79076.1 hypothetical protein CI667_0022285 [Klebsiella pneumoniae subsp. pneumoniae]HBR0904261.1 hypothetical protein [Klebsiella pneumoniae]HBR0909673.1 hypothetical protein [Klebsiella pneumoniae]HBR1658878.1 hypothetical protein [Klebsiella pneumoniae]